MEQTWKQGKSGSVNEARQASPARYEEWGGEGRNFNGAEEDGGWITWLAGLVASAEKQ